MGTFVYDEPKLQSHNHTNDFNLIQQTKENLDINDDAK
jgi:hypothetical protein